MNANKPSIPLRNMNKNNCYKQIKLLKGEYAIEIKIQLMILLSHYHKGNGS